jgi:hypothetical protein
MEWNIQTSPVTLEGFDPLDRSGLFDSLNAFYFNRM